MSTDWSEIAARNQAGFAAVADKLAALPGAVVEHFQDAERGIWSVELRPTEDVRISAEWTGAGARADLSAGYDGCPATLTADELRAVAAALIAIADCLTPAATTPAPSGRPPER